MDKKIVSLSSLEDLKIFMSPVRQQLLRCLHISGEPMTAKGIADCLNISPSSAKHHLGKLENLGLVELNRTEVINGINARYYSVSNVTVSIGSLNGNELNSERRIIIENLIKNTLDGLYDITQSDIPKDEVPSYGDFLNGVVHLTPADSKKLHNLITEFIDTHETKTEGSEPWEYSLVFYNTNHPK